MEEVDRKGRGTRTARPHRQAPACNLTLRCTYFPWAVTMTLWRGSLACGAHSALPHAQRMGCCDYRAITRDHYRAHTTPQSTGRATFSTHSPRMGYGNRTVV